jgi:histidyl-tRNA synthetase
VGIEAIGSLEPSLDAETILLLSELLESAGAKGVRLRISSLGTPETRRAYSEELRAYLQEHESQVSEDVRNRIDANPLRAFDSDDPGTKAVMQEAPKLLERLASDDEEHFKAVLALLDDAGQAYEVDPTLVRGIDYYTRTVFEFTSDALGAQSGVGGGGRYDGLMEQLGGPTTPAVGWAAGIERILLVSDVEAGEEAPDVYVARDGDADAREAFGLMRQLRSRGLRAQMEQAGRSLKGQLKQADRIGAQWVLIVGDGGVRVRNMQTGDQQEAASVERALELIA